MLAMCERSCHYVGEVVLTFNISINRDGLVAFVMPTQDKHSSHIRSSRLINPLAYKLINNQQLPNTSTRQLTNSPARQLTNLPTHKLIISPTQKLKSLFLFLQNGFSFRSVLAKI
jgi:hypothetical protein